MRVAVKLSNFNHRVLIICLVCVFDHNWRAKWFIGCQQTLGTALKHRAAAQPPSALTQISAPVLTLLKAFSHSAERAQEFFCDVVQYIINSLPIYSCSNELQERLKNNGTIFTNCRPGPL